MNLNSTQRTIKPKRHFKEYARDKVRELGIDGAVQHFRNEIVEAKKNPMYEKCWLKIVIFEMSIDYIVNDLGE